jgi:hypothetical protein
MSEQIKNALWLAVLLSTPSFVGWFVLKRVRMKSKKWENKKKTFWRAFCWSYFILQLVVTILCIWEGLHDTEEYFSLWGLEVFTILGSAFSTTPFLSLIVAACAWFLQSNNPKSGSIPKNLPSENADIAQLK